MLVFNFFLSYSGQCDDNITNQRKVHPPHHNHKHHHHHHASAQRKQNWLLKIYDLSQFLQCMHKISHFLQQLWEVPLVPQEVGLTSFTKTNHTYHTDKRNLSETKFFFLHFMTFSNTSLHTVQTHSYILMYICLM